MTFRKQISLQQIHETSHDMSSHDMFSNVARYIVVFLLSCFVNHCDDDTRKVLSIHANVEVNN